MKRISAAVAALACIGATPAMAAMGACEGAYVKQSLEDQIRLYSICLEGLFEEQMPGAFHNRGVAYLLSGQYDQALSDFERSILYDGTYGLAYFNRATVYAQRGMADRAIEDLSTALDLQPSRVHRAAYLRRAALQEARGNYDLAIRDYEAVVALPIPWFGGEERKSKQRARAEALIGHSRVLSTATSDQVRDGARAIELAQAALEIEDTALARSALAAAYAEAGQMEAAQREQALALQMAPAGSAVAQRMSEDMALYQAGQPYRRQACTDAGAECMQVAWTPEEMQLIVRKVNATFSSGVNNEGSVIAFGGR